MMVLEKIENYRVKVYKIGNKSWHIHFSCGRLPPNLDSEFNYNLVKVKIEAQGY